MVKMHVRFFRLVGNFSSGDKKLCALGTENGGCGWKSTGEIGRGTPYNGDANDSAKMNIWLHNTLMTKLAENGGKVPADLPS